MKETLRIKAYRVAIITAIWILVAVSISVYDYVIQLDLANRETAEDTSLLAWVRNSFKLDVTTGIIGSALGGLLGIPLLFYLQRVFRQRTFAFIVIVNSVLFLAVIYLINVMVGFVFFSDVLTRPLFSSQVLEPLGDYLTSALILKSLGSWFVIVLITIFMLQVSDKLGQGVLLRFILGKYHKPRSEQRIFMFLDLKSSTTLAERLGHNRYFQLLRNFYADATDPILNCSGEIYQYVGDEIVVSWRLKRGLRSNNCLRCFFDIEEAIDRKADWYNREYQVVPEFKAGLHTGVVTVGEIGVVKKDILFTGDVLNTSARIQAKCNELRARVLVSKELLDLLDHSTEYISREIGEIELRGREQKVALFAIEKRQ